jgi:hypothetical protein
LTEDEFAAGVERARGLNGIILPYKKTGAMGSEAPPIYASRLPGGRVRVHLRQDIFATEYASDRDLRLPPAIGKGVELNEMDVVGVKFLDEGVVSFFPAFLLMHLENEVTRVALAKPGEAFAVGLTTGVATVAAAAAGAEALSTEGGVDAAGGLDLTSRRIQEHQEWITDTWPDQGRAFVSALQQLTPYARDYGLVQGASGVIDFGNDLQKGYRDWRAAANALKSRLSEGDVERIEQIGKETEQLLQAIDDARKEVPRLPTTASASEEAAKAPSEEAGSAPEPVMSAVKKDGHVAELSTKIETTPAPERVETRIAKESPPSRGGKKE